MSNYITHVDYLMSSNVSPKNIKLAKTVKNIKEFWEICQSPGLMVCLASEYGVFTPTERLQMALKMMKHPKNLTTRMRPNAKKIIQAIENYLDKKIKREDALVITKKLCQELHNSPTLEVSTSYIAVMLNNMFTDYTDKGAFWCFYDILEEHLEIEQLDELPVIMRSFRNPFINEKLARHVIRRCNKPLGFLSSFMGSY